MHVLKKWADRKYGLLPRVLLLIPAGALFAILIPYSLMVWLPRLDTRLQLPSLSFGLVNYFIGGVLIFFGMVYALWSIGSQLFDAGGTPVPVIPTQKLLITPPFSHCRNPMAFGALAAYLGFAIPAGSIPSIALMVALSVLLILYIKKIEE